MSSEAAFDVTNSVGNGTGAGQTGAVYYYVSNGNGGEDASGAIFTIPATYRKGYAGFYQGKSIKFINAF
jgi:hypothetical protein